MNLFAYRTHTHKHGTVVTGYLYREQNIQEIARHDPQEPQMFYPMEKEVVVDNGDILAARCTFNTTLENKPVYIGIWNKTMFKISVTIKIIYAKSKDDKVGFKVFFW